MDDDFEQLSLQSGKSASNLSVPSTKKIKTPSPNNKIKPISAYFAPKSASQNSLSSQPAKESKLILTKNTQSAEINFPVSFEDLQKSASKEFKINLVNLEIRDLQSQIITKENFGNLSRDQTLLILDTKDDGKLKEAQEFIVDITPSKNILLKAGTAEYDVPSAIAELVDNSIQAVRDNPEGDRLIVIKLEKQKETNHVTTVNVWDNGRGMDVEELRRWATMGISQSDDKDQLVTKGGTFSDKGFISRFGVGAKRAAFFLGKKVTVFTKPPGSKWVNMTTLSSESLSEHGDEWKATIKVRDPSEREQTIEHFTHVKISHLNFRFDNFEDDIKQLRQELAQIYYYYIHDKKQASEEIVDEEEEKDTKKSKGKQKKSTKKDKEEESDQKGSTPSTSQSYGTFDIKVQGKSLSAIGDDMQTLYNELGKNAKDFIFKVNVADNKSSTVKLRLMYFPYEDEAETMPVPNGCLVGYTNPNEVPLPMRKPGIEVFWNERLIKEAHIPLLDGFGFTALGVIDGQKLEEKWFYRVKGMLFVNSDFPVTHNKMHICKEDSAFKALKTTSNRRLEKQFRKWLLDSHITLDQEIQYLEMKFNANENKTYCGGVSFGSTVMKIGDYVQLLVKKNKIFARIEQIFFKGTPEAKLSEGYGLFVPFSHKELPKQEYPIPKIKKKLTQDEFNQHVQQQKDKLPSKMKLFAGSGVDPLKDTLQAGEEIKNITVVVYDKQGKVVEKSVIQEEPIGIIFTAVHLESGATVYERELETSVQGSKCSFSSIKCFNKSGQYILRFSSKLKGLSAVEHNITVTATDPARIEVFLPEAVPENTFMLDTTLPALHLRQVDAFDNVAPLDNIPPILDLECYLEGSKEKIELATPSISLTDSGEIEITELSLQGGKLEHDIEDAVLSFNIGLPEPVLFKFKLIAGPAAQFSYEPDPFTNGDKVAGYPNKSFLPEFKIAILDKHGNKATHVDRGYMLEITSKSFKKPAKVSLNNGVGHFQEETIKIHHQEEEEDASVSVSLVDTNEHESVVIQEERVFQIIPSEEPAQLQLLTKGAKVLSDDPLRLGCKPGVNISWSMCVFNEACEKLTVSGTVETSWTEHARAVENTSKIALPPANFTRTSGNVLSCFVTFTPTNGSPITTKFTVVLLAGAPHSLRFQLPPGDRPRQVCGELIEAEVLIEDEQGNEIEELEPADQEFIRKILPQINVDGEFNPRIESCNITPLDNRYQVKLVLVGTGNATISVVDPSGRLKEGKFQLKLNPGQAAALRVNKCPNVILACRKGELLPELCITCCDAYGNITPYNVAVSLVVTPSNPFKKIPSKISLEHGLATLTGLQLDAENGEFQIQFKSTSVQLEPCVARVRVEMNPEEPCRFGFTQFLSNITAGEMMPRIEVQILSQLGKPVLAQLSSISLLLEGTKYPCSGYNEDEEMYYFDNVKAPCKADNHELKFIYQEATVGFHCESPFTVDPSTPAKIDTAATLPSVFGGQMLIESLEVFIVDKYGNRITEPLSNLFIEMTVVPNPSVSQNVGQLPVLVGTTKQPVRNGKALFQNIKMAERTGAMGIYHLTLSARGLNLRPKSLEFFYCDKEEDMEYKGQLQQKLLDLNKVISTKSKEIDDLKEKIKEKSTVSNEVHVKIAELKKKAQEMLSDDGNSMDELLESSKTIQPIIKKLDQEMTTFAESPRRPASYPNNPNLDQMVKWLHSEGTSTGIVGVVAELGCVEDDKEAAILARICGNKLVAVVLEDQKTFDKYYNMFKDSTYSLQLFPLDSVLPYKKKDATNEKPNELPLTPVEGAPLDGFLGFAVNRIQLRKKHEHLRRYLFWNIFRDIMVFSTLKQGMNYRNHLVKMNKICPTIIALEDDEVIEQAGFITIGDKRSRNNNVCFGQLPATDLPRYQFCHEIVSVLKQLKTNLQEISNVKKHTGPEIQQMKQQIEQLENEVRELKQEIRQVQQELEEDPTSVPSKKLKRSNGGINKDTLNEAPPKSNPKVAKDTGNLPAPQPKSSKPKSKEVQQQQASPVTDGLQKKQPSKSKRKTFLQDEDEDDEQLTKHHKSNKKS